MKHSQMKLSIYVIIIIFLCVRWFCVRHHLTFNRFKLLIYHCQMSFHIWKCCGLKHHKMFAYIVIVELSIFIWYVAINRTTRAEKKTMKYIEQNWNFNWIDSIRKISNYRIVLQKYIKWKCLAVYTRPITIYQWACNLL